MINKTIGFIKAKKAQLAGLATVGATSMGLTVASTGVTIEAGDLTTINDANSAYLSSAFQVVELLPYIAVIAWGFYVLNKLFGIIPSAK